MRLWRAILNQYRKSRVEAELDSELRAYADLLTDQKVRAGMDPGDARRAALIDLGGLEAVKEQVRDARSLAWLDSSRQDARYAFRALRRTPGFTAIAVLSLALGIGANSALFSVFYAVLVRPLPYPGSADLLSAGIGDAGKTGATVLTPEFVAWQLDQHVFTGRASWNDQQYNLTGAAAPERIIGATVSNNFLQVLGLHPAIGRDFAPAEHGAAIITSELWQRQFSSDPAAIGRPIMLSDTAVTLVGVLPQGFRFPGDLPAEILVPDDLPAPPNFNARRMGLLHAIGRLRPGVSETRAAGELDAISRRYAQLAPQFFRRGSRTRSGVIVHSLHSELVGDTRPVLVALLGAVGLVLLLACVNVANLQLARAAVRQREIGMRSALGASRMRLARWLVMENLVLAGLAGAIGLAVAAGLLSVFRASAGVAFGGGQDLTVGWRLAVDAFAFSTLAGLLVGIAPALLAPRMNLNDVLKSGALSVIGGRGAWLRSLLVGGQVALALVLLLASGLLLRSMAAVLAVDLGFRPGHLLMASLRLTSPRQQTDGGTRAFLESLLGRLRALPGVDSAAVMNSPPMTGYSLGMMVTLDGRPPEPGHEIGVPVIAATPDYLRVLGIRLVRGRFLDDRDRPGSPDVAVVSERFVEHVFHGADPLGKHVFWSATPTTVVGVIGDVRHSGPERPAEPEMVISEWQHPQSVARLLLRTYGDPMALAGAVRPLVWSLDKDLPVSDITTMDDRLALAGGSRRLETGLLGAFGLLALLLSAVGIYGVAAEAVAQRTREIGLRMALGARSADIARSVMGRGMALAAGGIAAGAAAAFFLVRYVKALLFGIQPGDPMALAAAVVLLFAVAVVAGAIPARRAARIDPVAALRCD